MIEIAEAYKESEQNGEKFTYLDCACEHCDQPINQFVLSISVFLSGAAVLAGPKFGYVGITCPSCLNTILLKGDSLVRLYQDMELFFGPNNSHLDPALRYHSSVIYSPNQIEYLDACNIPTWCCPLSDNSKENFHGELGRYLESEPRLSQEYLCSYIYGNAIPIGSFASIWWFRTDEIEKLVQIENEHQIRVFPRYVHKMAWYDRFDYFCWRYRIYQDYLTSMKKSADENYDLLREYAYQEDINLDRLYDSNPEITTAKVLDYLEQHAREIAENDIQVASEFLDLLVNFNPQPWDIPGTMSDHFSGLWKSISPFGDKTVPSQVGELIPNEFKPRISNQEVNGLTNKIRPFITKSHVQDWAVEHHQAFIKDYFSLARRPDFSYGLVWGLKCRYLKDLTKIAASVSFAENKYAFISEGDAWRIKYDGEVVGVFTGKGFRYISYLIANQGTEIDVFSLGSLDGDSKNIIAEPTFENFPEDERSINDNSEAANVDDIGDSELKEIYENKKQELRLELKDAQKLGDKQMYNETRVELEKIEKLYSETFWKGKTRKFDDGTMKDRRAISKAISRSIDTIEGKKPSAQSKFRKSVASHFREALKPISLFKISYTPKEKIDWML